MTLVILLMKRLLIMLLFMLIGAGLFKKHYITEEGSRSLANLLIYLALPCVIVKGFLVERTEWRLKILFISVFVSVLILLISIFISKLFFKKNPIGHFAAAFSNPSFFGIPLITAVLNEDAVFAVAPFIACLNILQWTYGVAVLKGERIHINLKNILLSPFMIGFLAGIFLFISRIEIPAVFTSVINTSAGLNTPIAMIVTGVYLAKTDLKAMLTSTELYKLAAVRLILTPLVSFGVLCLLPDTLYELKMSLLIAAACPVGSNVAVYAQLYDKNYSYAVQTVVLSTLLSVFSIPVFVFAAQNIWAI